MSNGHDVRRWALLQFSVAVGGSSARTTVELARALDCFRAGRDAQAGHLFVRVAAARPTDPEPADYLGRLRARGVVVGWRANVVADVSERAEETAAVTSAAPTSPGVTTA